MRDRGTGTSNVLVLLIALVLIGGGLVVWQWRAAKQKVVLLGDSITDMSAPVFQQTLGGKYDLIVSGVPNARADDREPDVPALAATQPKQVVINLGTNDILHNTSLDEAVASLTRIGGSFPSASCIHLVTINEGMIDFSQPDLHDRSVTLNQRVRALADEHHWHIIDWNAAAQAYEASGEKEGPLSTDTVHPTAEKGQPILADAYLRGLQTC
jgi:lysophospholipase L1-like esterase